MDSKELIKELLSVFLPDEISLHFDLKEVSDKKGYIRIRLEELPDLVPSIMKDDEEVVLDGFCNPIELQSFPLKGKPVYLHIYRRRWKYKGCNKHYSNSYELNPQGVKATNEFAAFLKASYGQTPDQYNAYISGLMR